MGFYGSWGGRRWRGSLAAGDDSSLMNLFVYRQAVVTSGGATDTSTATIYWAHVYCRYHCVNTTPHCMYFLYSPAYYSTPNTTTFIYIMYSVYESIHLSFVEMASFICTGLIHSVRIYLLTSWVLPRFGKACTRCTRS